MMLNKTVLNIYIAFFFLIALSIQAEVPSNFISASNCKSPYGVKIEESGLDSVKLSWRSQQSDVAFKIKWREKDSIYLDSNITPLIDENYYTITNLKSGTKYYFRIKTICDDGESKWSNEYSFITHIDNPSQCGLNLKIKDFKNNKIAKTYFYIENHDFKEKKLGVDVFIKNVDIIVKHGWTSDLQINLISPSGKKLVLSSYVGNNDTIGYGKVDSSECISVVSFSDEACESIDDNNFPFAGSYRPHESISGLYDSISPAGVWTLEIIDRSPGYSGTLQYVNLDFEPLICPVPRDVSLVPVDDKSVMIFWNNQDVIDSLIINSIDTITVPSGSGNYLYTGLLPASTTDFSFVSKCQGGLSPVSCLYQVQTLCSVPQLREDFDSYNPECAGDDCLDSDIWFNIDGSSARWLLNHGQTSTANTGPSSDIYGNGNYLYIESSNRATEDTVFVLQSQCLDMNFNFSDCKMSFYYHMYGIDIQELSLLCSSDGGENWDTLFYKEGPQGQQWHKAEINLIQYLGLSCIYKFVGKTAKDKNLGDIAIDDIIFYNAKLAQSYEHLYYPDRDGDGYGKDTVASVFCVKPPHFVSNNLDCNDDNASINPSATEIECNLIDENCNGMADDNPSENPLLVSLVTMKNASCNAKNDGSIILKVEQGIPPYEFLWSNGSTDSILTHVPAGKYWCRISDNQGCAIVTDTFELQHDNPIDIEVIEKISPACNGAADGKILIDFTGGISPFSYLWSTGDTTRNLINVQAGIYNVTITDSSGCSSVSDDIDLKANTVFDIREILKLDPTCYNKNNGKIFLSVTGGEIPYSFEWNTGDTTAAVSGLLAGDYYCTITDNSLCYQVYGPVHLDQPDSLKVYINAIDHVRCIGEENGLIELKTSGGTPPYSYLWKNDEFGFISFNDDIYDLKPGIYKVQVSDRNGCHLTMDSIEIKTQDSIDVKVDSIAHVFCPASNEGYIRIKADKGYGEYHFLWNDGTKDTDFLDSLKKGFYGVTTTDDLGCRNLLNNIEIKNLNIPLDVDLIVLDSIMCYGDSTGVIAAYVNSERIPLDFNWSVGYKDIVNANTDTIRNLGTGNYNVTVTDISGCTGESQNVTLLQPSQIIIDNVSVEDILCYADSTGKIDIDVTGGVPDYDIVWNDGDYSGASISRLGAGTYQATITDRHLCEKTTGEIVLTQPGELKVDITAQPEHGDAADGSARITVEGGVSPYRFEWDENAGNQEGNEAFNLKSGWYNVSLTDYNECFKLVKVYIPKVKKTLDMNTVDVNVFPNPAADFFVISGDIISNSINIELFDVSGRKKDISLINMGDKKLKVKIKNKLNGVYILKLAGKEDCYYMRIAIVNK